MKKSPRDVVSRFPGNPILTATDLPYPGSLVFNAGVVKYDDSYIMVFRNDIGFSVTGWNKTDTNLGIAFSTDGKEWKVSPQPWLDVKGLHPEISRFYDPRLSVIEGKCYLCFAADTTAGIVGGIALIEDFKTLTILSLSAPDNRNMVLLPDRVNGKFMRLERPFPVYGTGGENFDIWLSESDDLKSWGNSRLVLSNKEVPFSNSKIGPAAPPIKTAQGYLTTFHAVHKSSGHDLFCWGANNGITWNKIYYAGLMLLDLEDPSRVIGLCREPFLTPETQYELEGFRGSVIFPGGMILEDSGEVKIYYGAADTVECLATAQLDDLLALCDKVELSHYNLNGLEIPCKL